MRVALVYRSFHTAGSLPRATVELASHLSAHHDVHVFSIGSSTDRSLAPACTFHDVPVAHVGDGKRFSARELLAFSRAAARRLDGASFDLVHTLAPSTWVADVLHVPGLSRDEAELQHIPSWRYAAAGVRHPGETIRRLLERKALSYPGLRRIHAATPAVREALARRYGIGEEHVLVVPPSVDLDEFGPPADKAAARAAVDLPPTGSTVVLFCGTDFGRKGLDRAIRALARTSTEPPPTLLVVGGGSEEPYRRLATGLGVESRVRFLGSRTDAWRFYQASDLVVLPTRADVWGITPFEAMACGVPPIVTAAAGSAIAVRDGETGIVLPEPFSVQALSDAVDALASNPERRAKMGAAGLDAVEPHSRDHRMREIEDDLRAVAERRIGAMPIPRRRAWPGFRKIRARDVTP